MSKFFNVIPGEDNTCCVLLYGTIGESDHAAISSSDFVTELKQAELTYDKIDIRINSYGGEVYSGIAMFNAIRSSQSDINIYIDGIAASMASAIALCGKPVHMSEYGQIMIHAVSGGMYGNAKVIKKYLEHIDSLETTLAEIYSKKMDKTPDEIKQMYFDGSDHWISSSEALALGLVDSIFDASPIEDTSPKAIYQEINNRLARAMGDPQNKNNMDISQFITLPRFSNCTDINSVFAVARQLDKENADLKSQNERLTKESADRRTADINNLLNEALNDGRIDATTQPIYADLLANNFDGGSKALAALSKKQSIVDVITPGGNPPAPQGAWDKRQDEIRNNLKK